MIAKMGYIWIQNITEIAINFGEERDICVYGTLYDNISKLLNLWCKK